MKVRNMPLRRVIFFIFMFAYFTLFFQDALAEISWTTIGPRGGAWLTTIEISPNNPGVVYVGCDVGGIYRSMMWRSETNRARAGRFRGI